MSCRAPLWEPAPQRVRQTQMYQFMTQIAQKYGIEPEWEALRQWSIDHRDRFWEEMLAFAQVEPSRPAKVTMAGEGMLGTRWFEGMTLNYARHMLRFDGDADAILFEDERGRQARLTHRQLREQVARVAAALRQAGVRCGDRVAGFMPNIPETVIAMLAATSLGAVWSSCSPDFGVRGVLDRFGQIEPVVLFATDGYTYGGKRFETLGRVGQMAAQLPSVRQVVVVPYLDPQPKISEVPQAVSWQAFAGSAGSGTPELEFVEVPFSHPLFILFSSGTTGVPKCIVHGHGGTLLQHMKELMLHCDLRAGERSFYFTTCGWMMWNWLVSSLGVGAAVVLYEGNPAFPDAHRLWQMAERLRISLFGTSPKFLGACQKAGIHPGREHDLSSIRIICSTGSPLSEELFRWVYDEVKKDVQLASISGGTDIISCFMLGNPMLPVYPGEIQCRGLAMDVHAWDENGRPVIGQKGELVCTSPFPSQPVCFWNDPDGRKYRAAYFEHFPGRCVWRHGDYIEITRHGGVIVYGRSDATLNPGGVRIGTAEIYRVVEGLPEIVDSIVVGRDTPDQDVEICLFVVLQPGLRLDEALERKIRTAIAENTTKRHVPKYIRQVSAIPCTISGKKVELAVRQVLHGQEVANKDALANPEVLEEFRNII
jgi:acetoacetyl-CoA synthetase